MYFNGIMIMSKYSIFDVVSDVVKDGKVSISSNDTASKRIAICNECPELKEPFKICSQCGCITTAKVKFSKASCPLGKW